MCGIVGVINGSKVVNDLITGLEKLEYRGYDSAGLALVQNKTIQTRKAEGSLINLKNTLENAPLEGRVGIAHTRWATHGAPVTKNAHPHSSHRVSAVHNGIIENYEDIRNNLEAHGFTFSSDTDSEVIPHLITLLMEEENLSPEAATQEATKILEGTYALGVLFEGEDDFFCAAKKGSPLAIGYGQEHHAMYLASDAIALSSMTNQVTYLEDGDFAVIQQDAADIYDESGERASRDIQTSAHRSDVSEKNGYEHFMLKEIHEQPEILETIFKNPQAIQDGLDFNDIDSIKIVACGTSLYAGHIAKYWFEEYAKIPVEIDIASEFRYRNAILSDKGCVVFISQSGETADTLAALNYAKEKNQKTISLVNVAESSIARATDHVVLTKAGAEIGVASTKAFIAQLASLSLLVLKAAEQRNTLRSDEIESLVNSLQTVPEKIQSVLENEKFYEDLGWSLEDAVSSIFIGRGVAFPLAMEGALKLKEISYIHAEGIGAGELKHGPIALIDENMPVIAIVPPNELHEKTLSNVQEVHARHGQVIFIGSEKLIEKLDFQTKAAIPMPDCDEFIIPFLYIIPLQLLSYYTALARGCNIDKPRNLAKSVTVE